MKGNSVWLIGGIAVLAVLALVLFGGKLFAKNTDTPNGTTDTPNQVATGGTAGTSRLPGESIQQWILRRNSEGWVFA